MPENTQTDRYLYVVDYREDAERKRAEYLFNNWEEGTIDRPSGLVRIAEGVDQEALYEGLVAKVPPDQVEMLALESVETDLDPERVDVDERIAASADAVETFLEYVLSKRKAVVQSATHNEYEIYTKKGRAQVSYTVAERAEGVGVHVTIEGYAPAPRFLGEFFQTELAEYAASQTS
jgi:hypothetical protein